MRVFRSIERYILWAVIPYIVLSTLLLTSILFIQQLSRFGDLLLGNRVPFNILTVLTISLLPSVLTFTLPMALLAGVIIGFSRLGSDSELIAFRAAGVGTWRLLTPTLIIGVVLTLISLHVNLNLAPEAIRSLRRVVASAALHKLESPVEPRSFNTEIPGYVIYVRDGIKAEGLWGRVFLYKEEKDGSTRLVTARSGRIDSKGVESELVLTDATLITLPAKESGAESYIMERLDQLRISLDTGRKNILSNLEREETEKKPPEMGLTELANFASTKEGAEKREAQILIHKRLAMSLVPLFFAFLGTMIGIRVRKGGRGAGMLLSLIVMLSYYFLTLVGEQMARGGSIPTIVGGWLAPFVSICFGLILLLNIRRRGTSFNIWRSRSKGANSTPFDSGQDYNKSRVVKPRLLSFPSLLDLDLLKLSVRHFSLIFLTLVGILLIFTLFELWRFIMSNGVSFRVVSEYLLFLMPMVGVQLLPASTLIALLSTYALTARRNEVVAWGASGQSVYRLMVPGLVFALCLSSTLWLVQENIMPAANIRQDTLRAQIRGVSQAAVSANKLWLASGKSYRLYSYEMAEGSSLSNLILFDFDPEGIHIKRILMAESASWGNNSNLSLSRVNSLETGQEGIKVERLGEKNVSVDDQPQSFKPMIDKPSHLSAIALSEYIKASKLRGAETLAESVALQKKYSNPFSVLLMAFISLPLALTFGRKSTIIGLCSAIVLSLVFWAISSGFQQLGEYGHLTPIAAAWSPILIFTAVGVYLLSRTRT